MRWVFWIELEDGQLLRWPHLTQHQAKCMYKWTSEITPDNVKRYGWEEMA